MSTYNEYLRVAMPGIQRLVWTSESRRAYVYTYVYICNHVMNIGPQNYAEGMYIHMSTYHEYTYMYICNHVMNTLECLYVYIYMFICIYICICM